MNNVVAGVVQMISTSNVETNIAIMERLVHEAALQGAQWVLLPEYWPIMSMHDSDKLSVAEPFGHGILQKTMQTLAKNLGIVLIGGTIPLQNSTGGKVFNSMLTYDEHGQCIGRYDKMHLFSFSGEHEYYSEQETVLAGDKIPKLSIHGIPVGQGVCYDLRFPELFRAQLPFDILLLPAAFVYTTGQVHWELLLRARAVENQCFVLASGQGGKHDYGRCTFGHSMIIDPWGDVLGCVEEGEGVVVAELPVDQLRDVREKLPALQHRLLF